MNNVSRGVRFLGILFIASSLLQMSALGYARYQYLFQYLPVWMMLIRFIGSWVLRILGLIAGVGLLRGKEFSRKIILGISGYSLVTLYWKHPYDVVVHNLAGNPVLGLWETMGFDIVGFNIFGHLDFASYGVVFLCAEDALFFCFVLWYLNLGNIKKQFD